MGEKGTLNRAEDMEVTAPPDATARLHEDCPVRDILNRIGDKWSVQVVCHLSHGILRFSDLRRRIDHISHRMLTATLRALERDGLVSRTQHATIPPRVEYALTPLGETLMEPIQALDRWAREYRLEVSAARAAYDERRPPHTAAHNSAQADAPPADAH